MVLSFGAVSALPDEVVLMDRPERGKRHSSVSQSGLTRNEDIIRQ